MAGEAETVREAIEALNRGDVEALLSHTRPEIEVRDPDRTGNVVRGQDALRGFIAEWLENFNDYRIKIEELRKSPDGRIVALCTQSGRGKGSGIEVSDQINIVFGFRDGKATEYVILGDRSEALRHAGLEG